MGTECDPIEVLSPFLAIIRAPYLAGPYKLVALEAIQSLVASNILCERVERTSDALADVVDAVSKCKFIQTDAVGDDLVQLQIVQTIDSVVLNPVRMYLTDETAWSIVETSFSLLIQSGSNLFHDTHLN